MSRFKICTYELGDSCLNPEEQERIREALEAEAERVRGIAVQIEFSKPESLHIQESSR